MRGINGLLLHLETECYGAKAYAMPILIMLVPFEENTPILTVSTLYQAVLAVNNLKWSDWEIGILNWIIIKRVLDNFLLFRRQL